VRDLQGDNGEFDIVQVTVSKNRANGYGGGLYATDEFTVVSSTFAQNQADADNSGGGRGGAIYYSDLADVNDKLQITRVFATVAADNKRGANVSDDLSSAPAKTPRNRFELTYSLIETSIGFYQYLESPADPFWLGIDPMLGPLACNGGPALPGNFRVLTHALAPGSQAIDAAPFDLLGNVISDQRGTPWFRSIGPQLDLGAVESQPNPLPGDYNFDGVVNAADVTVWRETLGVAKDLRADGSGPTAGVPDGVVDQHDYEFWKARFGNVLGAGGGASADDPHPGPLPEGEGVNPVARVANALASQPPAPPGVTAAVGPAALLDELDRVADKPPAEPGAVERFVASPSPRALRTDVLIHWLASRSIHEVRDADTNLSASDDEGAEAGELCIAFDRVFDLLGRDG